MPSPDLVDRLWSASEHDEGIPPDEAQALFIEAAEMIEMLRSLLEPIKEEGLEDIRPQGSARRRKGPRLVLEMVLDVAPARFYPQTGKG